MKQTDNFKLNKPDYTDVADISIINDNMDIIDNILGGHTKSTSNPHNVTKEQLGLENVNNTADNNKNVLSATKLTTARKINGTTFDGTADITVPATPTFTALVSKDLNTVTAQGFYGGGANNSCTNLPTEVSTFMLIVSKNTSGTGYTQLLVDTATQKMYVRNYYNQKWQDWIKIGPFIFNGKGKNSLVIHNDYNAILGWANGDYALSAGLRDKANGNYTVAIGGTDNEAYGQYSAVLGGHYNIAGSDTGNSYVTNAFVAGGSNNSAVGANSAIIGGNHLQVNAFNQVGIGCYNKLNSSRFLVVGCGTSDTARDNAFRVDTDGNCYSKSAFKASGADFAEYFESADGNNNNEDRRGLFVTLDSEKIRLANADDDYILGVVSATPTVTGDTQSEAWKDMYIKDVFGAILTEVVEVDESIREDGTVIPAHKETSFILNPDFDHTKNYKSRDERFEWSAVGLVGKLVVIDDGTCVTNGYCNVANGGIATKSEKGYRVMARLDDTHIKILLK